MRVFIAGFDTETNTFAPIPTGRRAFAEGFVAHGNATQLPENYCSAQLNVWRRRAEERGWEVAESLCTFAEPGGTIVRAVYESFRDEILFDLRRAMPVDLVILALHGAMAAEGYDDCEGDLLGRIRAIVGAISPMPWCGMRLRWSPTRNIRMLTSRNAPTTSSASPPMRPSAKPVPSWPRSTAA